MSGWRVASLAFALLCHAGLGAVHAEPTRTAAGTLPGSAASGSGSTLAAIKKRGVLRCGSNADSSGFGQTDARGTWSGFDVDICRAVATAVFGEPTRVEFIPLSTKERFSALRKGEVDLLSRETTWTLSREAGNGLLFTGIDYFDGQGFMVQRRIGIASPTDLASSQICVQQDTTTELNLNDFFRQRGLAYAPKTFQTAEAVETAYRNGQCAAYTNDSSALYILRASLPDPDANVVLPQIISKEPLGPAVRQGDDQWFLIVRWTLTIMIDAEEKGVTQKNVDTMMRGDDPRIRRLLGVEGNAGQILGLTADWAYRIIKYVGNYGDVYRRNLGDGSPLKIKRGLNELWTRGGLLYAPPVQ